MSDLKISEMQKMQKDLWEKHKLEWSPMEPVYGRNFFLWMIEEMGEAISIIKKKGEEKIMSSPPVRSKFVEELADILMYYNEILLRYNISSEEISNAYLKKHNKNMSRDYTQESANYLETKNESNIK